MCYSVVRRLCRPMCGVQVFVFAIVCFGLLSCSLVAAAQSIIHPGTTWKDTSGNVIEAHPSSIIKVGSTYYLIGSNHGSTSFSGINCYSSTDLVNWTFVADVFPPQPSGLFTTSAVIGRPKVLYNSANNNYVMWMHLDNSSYTLNEVAVAQSPTVCGTYTYYNAFQPLGLPSYDIGIYEDMSSTKNPKSAYLLTTYNGNGLRIELLNPGYRSVNSVVAKLPTLEGTSMTKVGSTYFLFGSHLTGWSSNDNQYSTATSLSGPWSAYQDFAPAGTNTFNSQDTWVLPVTGSSGTTYMYMGDRWDSSNVPSSLANSTYVWLPLTLSGTSASMAWYNGWNLNVSAGTWAPYNGTAPVTGSYKPLISENSGLCLSAVNGTEGTQLEQITCNGGALQNWKVGAEGSGYIATNQYTGMVVDDAKWSTSPGGVVDDWANTGGKNQQWIFRSNGQGYYNIINAYSGLCLDVTSASTASGAKIDQWTCNGGANQNWKQ